MKPVLVVLVLAAIGLGIFVWTRQPKDIPDLPLTSPDGQAVTLSKVAGNRDALAVFFMNDMLGKHVAGMVSALVPQHGKQLAIFGVLMQGDAALAGSLQAELGLQFPTYLLDLQRDPYAFNAFADAVGERFGSQSGVRSGTVVVLDPQRKALFYGSGEDVKQLPEKLKALGF